MNGSRKRSIKITHLAVELTLRDSSRFQELVYRKSDRHYVLVAPLKPKETCLKQEDPPRVHNCDVAAERSHT